MIIVIAVVLCSLEQNIATDPFTDIDFIVLQLGTFSFFKKIRPLWEYSRTNSVMSRIISSEYLRYNCVACPS